MQCTGDQIQCRPSHTPGIKSTAQDINQTAEKAALSTNKNTLHKVQYEEIDQPLLQFLNFCCQAQKSVTLAALPLRALNIKTKLLEKENNEIRKAEPQNFCASKNW